MISFIIECDRRVSGWMYRHGLFFLRISLAVVFIWFGGLKLVDQSPAAQLVKNTVYWFEPQTFLPILGWWEVGIGLFLLYRPFVKLAVTLLMLQMPGTILPLFLLPAVCFTSIPLGLTLEGQYIIKNLVLISAGIVVGGTTYWKEENDRRSQKT